MSVLSKSLKSPHTVGEEGDSSSPGDVGGSLPSFTGDKLMLEVKTLEFMEEVKLVSRASEPWNPLSSLVNEFEGDILVFDVGAWLFVEEIDEARLLRDLVDSPNTDADDDEQPEGGCRVKSTEEDDETLLRRSSASKSSSCPVQGNGMPSSCPIGIDWLSHSFSHSHWSTRLAKLPTLLCSRLWRLSNWLGFSVSETSDPL